jgi:hypothetical protein
MIESYQRRTVSQQIYRTKPVPTQADRILTCDRCADELASVAGVIIMPEADEAQLFCKGCFERTTMLRRFHPEWRFFNAAGLSDLEHLATELASKGLLAKPGQPVIARS